MTPCEEELLRKYLTHLNILSDEGGYLDFEEWYQAVRYALRSTDAGGGLRAALQGRPRCRPGLHRLQ